MIRLDRLAWPSKFHFSNNSQGRKLITEADSKMSSKFGRVNLIKAASVGNGIRTGGLTAEVPRSIRCLLICTATRRQRYRVLDVFTHPGKGHRITPSATMQAPWFSLSALDQLIYLR